MSEIKVEANPLDNVPEHLLSIPGVLQDFVNYYSVTAIKPQPQFAVQCAIAFGSVVMGRRWVTDQRNFSSLYFLNIGETGSGKEHTKTVLETMLEQAGLTDLIGPAVYTSGAGVMSTLINKPVHVAVVDELGRQLKAESASGMQHKADALTAIMECFGRQDGTLRPQGYSTMTLKSSEAEKLEKVVICPSLTLVGMSTLSEFFKAIGGGDVASGLLNRFITVKSEIGVQMSQRRHVSKISDRLAAWAKENAHAHVGGLDAGNIHDMPPNPLEVPFTPEAEELLFQYEARLVSAMEKEKCSGWEAMYNRSREIAMQWSIDYVEHYATETIKLFKSHISDGPFHAVYKAVYAKIEAAGQTGVTERELALSTSTFANMDRRKRGDVLDALANDRGIECRNLNEGKRGRPKMAWLVPE